MPARVTAVRALLATVVTLLALLPLAAPALAGDATVRIGDALDPMTLRIRPGTTVTWVNESGDRHRMRSYAGPAEFDSGNLEPGESFRVTFHREGTWRYLDERDDDDRSYWGVITVSGADSGGSTDPGAGEPSTTPVPDAILMAGRAFRPRAVTIDAGTTLRWRNDDDREHTVTARDGGFNSGVMGTGESWTKRFPTPGTFAYLCAIHPEMTGTITVRSTGGGPAPTPKPTAPPAASGSPSPSPSASGSTGASPTPSPEAAIAGGGSDGMPATTGAAPAAGLTTAAASEPVSADSVARAGLVVLLSLGAILVFARLLGAAVGPA